MERPNSWVWAYTVYWNHGGLRMFFGELHKKTFAGEKSAKAFAKKKLKECKKYFGRGGFVKPFIVKSCTVRRTFRDDVGVEFLTDRELAHNAMQYTGLVRW